MLDWLNHHACLLLGDRKMFVKTIEELIERVTGKPRTGQPDVSWLEVETFGIDDSRRLQAEQARRAFSGGPLAGGRKFFVIIAESMTIPAQHALLKVFEEPTAGTHFFLIFQNERELLPTLVSRCQIIRRPAAAILTGARAWAERFLGSEQSARLALAREMLDQADEPRLPLDLIKALERICHERLPHDHSPILVEVLETIAQARDYLADRSSLPKLIFEHLALTLPIWPREKV